MRDPVASLVGTAGQVGHHGDARGPPLDPIQGGAQPLGGGRHQRRVKGRAHVQGDDAFRARLLQAPGRDLQAGGRTGDDGLGRRVVVRRPRVIHSGESLVDRIRLQAEHGRHGAGACRRRVSHGLAPLDHRFDHVRCAGGSSRGQSRVLADRVPGCGCGLDASSAQQQRQPDADEAQRGLGVLGQSELVVVGDRQQAAKIDVGRGRALVAKRRDLCVFEKLSPHAGLLGALAWVDKRC